MAPRKKKRRLATDSDTLLEGSPLPVRPGTTAKRLASAESNCTRTLKFVDVTGRYVHGAHPQDEAEQKSIRVYVMQDYLRQKNNSSHRVVPPVMAQTVSSHVGRFRIAKDFASGSKFLPTVSSNRGLIMHKDQNQEDYTRTHDQTIDVWDLPQESCFTSEYTMQLAPDGSCFTPEDVVSQASRLFKNLLDGTAQIDPFARLPIDASMEIHEMLHYYKTSFWMNSLAVNPDGRWLTIAAMDPAMFHATLSLVAQHQSLAQGKPISRLYYYHRGAAIRTITSRLAHPVEATTDATIGAVGIMASSDNYLNLPSEIRQSHISGLASLVELRGGLQALSGNEPVKRVVTWADLVHAASHGASPRLGISKCNAGYDLQPLFLGSGRTGHPLRTVYSHAPPVPTALIPIFETIRLLCIAHSSPYAIDLENTYNRRVFGNVLYRVEYLLLDPGASLLDEEDQYERFQLLRSEVREPIFVAAVAGALIFTYLCLRNLAIPMVPFENLELRLRRNLEMIDQINRKPDDRTNISVDLPGAADSIEHPPKTGRYTTLLLWLLFLGFRATTNNHRPDDCAWFVAHASEMCRNLEIGSRSAFGQEMRKVVVYHAYCIPAADACWQAIMAHREEWGREIM